MTHKRGISRPPASLVDMLLWDGTGSPLFGSFDEAIAQMGAFRGGAVHQVDAERPDDGWSVPGWMTKPENAWRMAENNIIPFTEEVRKSKFDRPPEPFFSSLEPGTLPVDGAHAVEDVHAWLRRVHDALLGLPLATNYDINLYADALTKGPFGYAIPTRAALEAIVDFTSGGTIIELGAGRGYWAALLSNLGASVRAYDLEPDPARNEWIGTSAVRKRIGREVERRLDRRWFSVGRGDEGVAAGAGENDTLMIVWPAKETALASMSAACYKGRRIVYVGEPRGMGCADDGFFEQHVWQPPWRLVKVIRHCVMPWHYDRVFFYERG